MKKLLLTLGVLILAVGGYFGYTYYTFEFVKKNGEKELMTYDLSGENVKPFAPNTLVKAEISKTRVISGPNEVPQSEVPAKILSELETFDE